MYQLIAYCKFLLKSTNQHGVHSPFIFNLVTKCFYGEKERTSYAILRMFRKGVSQDHRYIEVRDFGAGSKVFSSTRRMVSKIAQNSGISAKRARLLNRLTDYLHVRKALELGTSVGLGSVAIAAGNRVMLQSLEGCPSTAEIAREHIRKSKLPNINVWTGEFQKLFQNNEICGSYFDLIFFDGNHQKRATLDYFHNLLPLAHNDSVFIFDDIYWSREMTEAWEEIKAHPSVSVSIDTFFWGLVFFRREQEKEHFIVRV